MARRFYSSKKGFEKKSLLRRPFLLLLENKIMKGDVREEEQKEEFQLRQSQMLLLFVDFFVSFLRIDRLLLCLSFQKRRHLMDAKVIATPCVFQTRYFAVRRIVESSQMWGLLDSCTWTVFYLSHESTGVNSTQTWTDSTALPMSFTTTPRSASIYAFLDLANNPNVADLDALDVFLQNRLFDIQHQHDGQCDVRLDWMMNPDHRSNPASQMTNSEFIFFVISNKRTPLAQQDLLLAPLSTESKSFRHTYTYVYGEHQKHLLRQQQQETV